MQRLAPFENNCVFPEHHQFGRNELLDVWIANNQTKMAVIDYLCKKMAHLHLNKSQLKEIDQKAKVFQRYTIH